MKKFFVDTNVFLRFLTNDVPEQADRVERLLRKAAAGEVSLVTNSMVLAELVWTMQSYYNLSRQQTAKSILAILNTRGLEVETPEIILKAVVWYEEKNVDFIDAYNAAWLVSEKLEGIYSFDRKHFSRLMPEKVVQP